MRGQQEDNAYLVSDVSIVGRIINNPLRQRIQNQANHAPNRFYSTLGALYD